MVVERTYDPELVAEAANEYPGEHLNFDAEEWLNDTNNIAFKREEDGSVGLLEFEYPGVYTGHFFFKKTSRGKAAKALATEMLRLMFSDHHAKIIRGLTPLQNQAARWLTRQLGFLSYGVIDTTVGPCELFIATPDRFYHTANKKD